METILEIALRENLNGFTSNSGTDKATDHSFDVYYDNVLEEYRNKEISLLEIGVAYGGSALIWHEFFPKAKLTLVDIINQVHPNVWNRMDPNRYSFHEMHGYTEETVNKIKEENSQGFDVIIEDGPHTLESQIFTIKNYVPLLKKDGILIIEDIQGDENGKILLESIAGIAHKSIDFVDLRPVKGRYDDLLIVVKK